jgi:malonate transporter and related proteins
MPALFFAKISAADLGAAPLGGFAAILYIGFFSAVAFGWLAQKLSGMAPAQGTDVIQGAGRFNTFVGVAIAEALYGAPGLQAAVLGSAILVPVVNVTMVTSLASMLGQGGGTRWRATLRELARNPLILSILLGLAFNLMGLKAVPVLHETAAVLGQGALPVMLLCVGANLRLEGIHAARAAVLWSTVGKLVVFPAAVLLAIWVLQPPLLVAEVALIYAALPVAVSAYTLARQMGGDARLMAAIITFQTLISFISLPLTLWLVGY